MIDIKLIRENPQKFKDASKAKNISADIDRLLELDTNLRKNKQRLQDISTQKNSIGKSIPKLEGDEKQQALKKLGEFKAEFLSDETMVGFLDISEAGARAFLEGQAHTVKNACGIFQRFEA